MRTFSYVRSDEMCSLGSTVTTTAGTTDTTYDDDWLTDGKNGRPAKATNGTATWSCAFSSAEVGCIAVCNHDIDAARTITIAGGISTTLTGPALPPDGIRLNPFALPTPASITALSVGVSGNSVALIIGEFIFGKVRTCKAARIDARFEENNFASNQAAISVQPFDPGLHGRKLSFSQLYSTSQLAELIAWWEAERAYSKPSLLIPDVTVQDAWVVKFESLGYSQVRADLWEAQIVFMEYPRVRW